ncbi:laccase domain-containing protein [Thermoleophilia bacterium SCSIO 60948]|nr:laccase domain-containing protein [Thermoleophilia bacterium SCSIO 60948]
MRWQEAPNGVRWLEAELPAARACFSTRRGGVSDGAFESLNLGLLTADLEPSVRENRRRLAEAVDVDPAAILFGRQVHGAQIERRELAPDPASWLEPAPDPAELDGQATSAPGLAPLVFVADCLPVALSGPDGIAMLHCGWRGLAGGIVERGVREVGARAAAIGPGIGRCCFEVGPEVHAEFAALGDDIADGRMLDLVLVARRLLELAGVETIEDSGLCTYCEPELFFSHRRDAGTTGRQAGLVVACPS